MPNGWEGGGGKGGSFLSCVKGLGEEGWEGFGQG